MRKAAPIMAPDVVFVGSLYLSGASGSDSWVLAGSLRGCGDAAARMPGATARP